MNINFRDFCGTKVIKNYFGCYGTTIVPPISGFMMLLKRQACDLKNLKTLKRILPSDEQCFDDV
jgi:hypothetical protein